MYFIFLGYYCCIEDFILKICNEQIREFRGKGCCKEYKKELKKIKNNCIEKTIDELFKIIENILKDLM
ncbi:hypothetical protein [Sulfurisphaera ohwakuensis]|uniref:hypothetical protein n=1 Tax=Sulfurisphaera ohwakuensis TaxID=69656 RepID=UPI0036F396D9